MTHNAIWITEPARTSLLEKKRGNSFVSWVVELIPQKMLKDLVIDLLL